MKDIKSDLQKDGWKYIRVTDLGSTSGNCELCGAKLRFQHLLKHSEVGEIKIGVECCQRVMNGEDLDYVKAEDKRIKAEVKSRVNKEKKDRENFEARNEFNRKRGLPELSWEEYQVLLNKNRRKSMANNLAKNRKGYGYKYADLAATNDYLDSIGFHYYQYIDSDQNGNDYIMTVPIKVETGEELPARRGCRVAQATLSGKSNPAQEQGSAITYARRYSLWLAFGLATEDDDGASMTVQNQERSDTPWENI